MNGITAAKPMAAEIPPIPVESATWEPAGELDYWVREKAEWWGRVRGPDGNQVWIKATDLRPAIGGGKAQSG
ncbi:MAG: hypothetical protein K0S98_1514 [Propionibacteriaceae bacterium]|nr:hypothetical protein [Propionibacteriaceae bacterium]